MRITRLLPVAAFALLPLTGCSPTTSAGLRADPSPELFTTARSLEQHMNNQAKVLDQNHRSGWDDLNRMFLLERPSTLTPYPMP